MKIKNGLVLMVIVLLGVNPTVWAMTIQMDYTYDTNSFFSSQARKDVLEAAADFFESRLTDDLSAISPSPGSGNSWDALITHPGNGTPSVPISNPTVPADTLTVYAGGYDLAGSAIGSGGPGGYSASGSQSFIDTVKARGEAGALSAPFTDFGPWGGSISFDTITNWYFDADATTDESFAGQIDFYSVALHELGHVLGFGIAGSWDEYVSSGVFSGPASSASNGGNVSLASGDGHWHSSITSTINGLGTYETAMDPDIASGVRKRFTDLDLAGLSDVGWQVTVIPLPSAFFLLAPGIAVLLALKRRGILR